MRFNPMVLAIGWAFSIAAINPGLAKAKTKKVHVTIIVMDQTGHLFKRRFCELFRLLWVFLRLQK
jgi:hypothetical protein